LLFCFLAKSFSSFSFPSSFLLILS
jgi:hypothetical protein